VPVRSEFTEAGRCLFLLLPYFRRKQGTWFLIVELPTRAQSAKQKMFGGKAQTQNSHLSSIDTTTECTMSAHHFFHNTPQKLFKGAMLVSAVLLPVLTLGGVSAWAQGSDMQILLDRMERMERDIRTLNRQIARGSDATAATAAVETATNSTAPAATAPAPATPAIEFTEGESALARTTVRLTALEEEVRQATGLAEGMSYQIEQISARLDKLITDLDYRLARLEGGTMGTTGGSFASQPTISAAPSPPSVSKVGEMAAPTETMSVSSAQQGTVGPNGTYMPPQSGGGTLGRISKNTLDQLMPNDGNDAALGQDGVGGEEGAQVAANLAPQTASPQGLAPMAQPTAAIATPAPEPVSVLPEGTPRERYQFAFGLMSQARYDDAEVALKEFIANHGDDALTANAWYWLGEAYYVRKTFMEAAQTFFQAYKIAPEGAKAPDSLLKLGMSMASLEKIEEACTTFGKLRKEFIDLKPSIKRTLNRETKRLKCQ
jgi:tol-pal system protein YbgF